MKYLEWNNIISAYFFNPVNAGKDIHLYLTKNDIIGLGKPYLPKKQKMKFGLILSLLLNGVFRVQTEILLQKQNMLILKIIL